MNTSGTAVANPITELTTSEGSTSDKSSEGSSLPLSFVADPTAVKDATTTDAFSTERNRNSFKCSLIGFSEESSREMRASLSLFVFGPTVLDASS